MYRDLFPRAFPGGGEIYTFQRVTKAICLGYRWGGAMAATSDTAKRGEILFSSSERGGCFQCHGGWNFTAVRFEGSEEQNIEGDARGFFNTGVSQYLPPNRGLYEYTMAFRRHREVSTADAPEHCNHRSVHA